MNGPGEVGNARVMQFDEMTRRAVGAIMKVYGDAGNVGVGNAAIDHDHRRFESQIVGDQSVVVQPRGADDDAVYLSCGERIPYLLFTRGVFGGVEQNGDNVVTRFGINAANHFGEEGVEDVGNDDGNRIAQLLGCGIARCGLGITEFAERGQDARADTFSDGRIIMKNTRYCSRGDVCSFGDILKSWFVRTLAHENPFQKTLKVSCKFSRIRYAFFISLSIRCCIPTSTVVF